MQLNQGYEYRERLDCDAEGLSLLAYLSRRHRHSSAAEWAARIAAGQVLIDARAVPPDSILRRGATLVWRRPPWVEPDAPTSFAVLYEDQDLLAVAKPAGLPTLPGANFLQTTRRRAAASPRALDIGHRVMCAQSTGPGRCGAAVVDAASGQTLPGPGRRQSRLG